jgi:hypothetical protein
MNVVPLTTEQADRRKVEPEGVNFYGLTPVAFAATSFARPLEADNFIYGLTPVELRQIIKDKLV